jgi:hypothetical protein
MPIEPSVTFFALVSLVLVLLASQSLRQRSLEGIVSNHDGRPLEEATVRLTDLSTGKVTPCRTDARGRFHFNGLSPEEDYELSVEHDEHLTEPIALWKHSSHCEPHLQFEPVPLTEFRKTPLIVLREEIADPHWFGGS